MITMDPEPAAYGFLFRAGSGTYPEKRLPAAAEGKESYDEQRRII